MKRASRRADPIPICVHSAFCVKEAQRSKKLARPNNDKMYALLNKNLHKDSSLQKLLVLSTAVLELEGAEWVPDATVKKKTCPPHRESNLGPTAHRVSLY